MTDGLDYIRNEVAANGNKGRVTVVRWEIDPKTGNQDVAIKIEVNAQVALRELSKPVNKRSYIWSRIRPLGQEPYKEQSLNEGSLSDPILRAKLKEALREEIMAEAMASPASLDAEELAEKPKRGRKKLEATDVQPEDSWTDPTQTSDLI